MLTSQESLRRSSMSKFADFSSLTKILNQSLIISDIERIRDGIGYKCGLFIQSLATFLGGFVIGFIEAWQLTLIIVFLAPFLIITTSYKGVVNIHE